MKPSTLFYWGYLLILFGLELHCVDAVYLSPAISSAITQSGATVTEKIELAVSRSWDAMFREKSFSAQEYRLHPPRWLGWPFLCVGIAMIVQGKAKS
ncbi:MAG: hypothetical protein IJG38_08760 [Thermoguttaceae bacterium]|nr:hypothetical protein [Thermoguttaceae bacterium]MBQ6616008.1 hypothetical protein [Thermoguttaceae bacterium]